MSAHVCYKDLPTRVRELVDEGLARLDADSNASLANLCAAAPEYHPLVMRVLASQIETERRLRGSPSSASRPQPSGVPGRFENIKKHGAGGFGAVYLADDCEVNRKVAYKVLSAENAIHADFRDAFLREPRLTARLRHDGIPAIYGMVTDEPSGLPAYAMQFVTGKTLRSVIAESRRAANPDARAALVTLLRYLLAACRTVEFAHREGVTHNDLHSDNVMVAGTAEAMAEGTAETFVIDWGIALEFPDGVTPPAAGADIVRLGCILHEILTGSRPERAKEPPQRFFPHADLDKPAVPVALAHVCRKALSTDDAVRYPSVKELADDTQAWIENRAVSAYRDRFSVRALRWANQRPRTATGGAIGLAAAVLLLVGGVIAQSEVRKANAREQQARDREGAERKEAAARRQWMLYNEGVACYMTAGANTNRRAEPEVRAQSEDALLRGINCLRTLAHEFPGDPGADYFLGLSLTELAYLKLIETGQPGAAESVRLCNEAERLLLSFEETGKLAAVPGLSGVLRKPMGSSFVSSARFVRMFAFLRLQRWSEALLDFDRAEPKCAEGADLTPLGGDAKVPTTEIDAILARALNGDLRAWDDGLKPIRMALLHNTGAEQSHLPWSRGPATDHVKAMRFAAYLAEARGVSGPAVYNAACTFAVAATELGIDDGERERRAAQAISYLKRIQQAGYFIHPVKGAGRRDELTKTDKDLNPLRNRPDFQELIRAVEVGGPK